MWQRRSSSRPSSLEEGQAYAGQEAVDEGQQEAVKAAAAVAAVEAVGSSTLEAAGGVGRRRMWRGRPGLASPTRSQARPL